MGEAGSANRCSLSLLVIGPVPAASGERPATPRSRPASFPGDFRDAPLLGQVLGKNTARNLRNDSTNKLERHVQISEKEEQEKPPAFPVCVLPKAGKARFFQADPLLSPHLNVKDLKRNEQKSWGAGSQRIKKKQ